LIPIILAVMRKKATWHGAEQMVIKANSIDTEEIKAQSPIYAKSVDRFYMPFIAGGIIASIIASVLSIDRVWPSLIITESILWADAIFGLDNLPLTSKASYLIQKYVTTTMPTDKELMIARMAMFTLEKIYR